MSIRIQSHGPSRWLKIFGLLLLVGLSVFIWLPPRGSTSPAPGQPAGSVWPWQTPMARTNPTEAPHSPSTPAGTRDASTLRELLFSGSFKGTQPVGAWCVTPDDRLQPCPQLRDRFEYYINGLGEISSAEVRVLIESEARWAHGQRIASDIMAVYDKYWRARNLDLRHQVNMNDVSTWLPALEEAHRQRQQIMGADWAHAFFDEEERDFRATHQQALAGTPPPPSPRDPVPAMRPGADATAIRAERVRRYGEEIANQLDALDLRQAEFDRKVAQGQEAWRQLLAQPQLSPSARLAEIQKLIDQDFAPQDRKRAQGLITLPPG